MKWLNKSSAYDVLTVTLNNKYQFPIQNIYKNATDTIF